MRAKKMRQDGGAEFISASLNTCGFLKRAALERKKSAGAYRALFPIVSLGFTSGAQDKFFKKAKNRMGLL